MYTYIYIYIHILCACVYIYIYIYVYVSLSLSLSLSLSMYIYIYIYTSVWVWLAVQKPEPSACVKDFLLMLSWGEERLRESRARAQGKVPRSNVSRRQKCNRQNESCLGMSSWLHAVQTCSAGMSVNEMLSWSVN